MAQVNVPLINGVYYAYADIIAKTSAGGQFYGFASINYTDKLERAYVRGTHRMPLGMSSGQYECTGDFELYLPQADSFRQFLALQGGGTVGYMQVAFTFNVSYAAAPELAPLPAITDTIVGAVITSVENSMTEGVDAIKNKFTFQAMQLIRNGVNGVAPILGQGVIG